MVNKEIVTKNRKFTLDVVLKHQENISTYIDKRTGYLIKSDPSSKEYINEFLEAVFKLLEDKKEYARVVNNGKSRVKKYYEWETIAKEFNHHINLELKKLLNKKQINHIFNKFYFEESNNLSFYKGYWDFPLFKKIADEISKMHPKTVLDCGCAKGFLVKHLIDYGIDAYGFDISEYAIDNCDITVKDRLKKADLTSNLKYKKKFDIITCLDILNYVGNNNIDEVISQLDSHLNKKGKILISMTVFPDLNTINYFKNHDKGIKLFKNKEWWINLFKKHGYYFIEIDHPDGNYPIMLHGLIFRKKDYKISVMMPNYNNVKFITESINSVLNQDYDAWELVIVDDCSTDGSFSLLTKYKKDKRIKIIKNKKNLGVAFTRNKCIANSSFDYIVQLDPDDFLEQTALSSVIKEFVIDSDLTLVYSDLYRIINKEKIATKMPNITSFSEWKIKPHAFDLSAYLKSTILSLGGFNEELKTCEDINFYYEIFKKNLKFKHINKFLYNWRINSSGLTTKNNMECVKCSYGKQNCLFYLDFQKRGLIK